MKPFNLSGRSALVTGATRGIGRALVDEFLVRGCNVVAVARDGDALSRLREEHPGGIHSYVADLSNPGEVDLLVREAPRQFESLSVVVNNAGVQTLTDFLSQDGAALAPILRRELAVNFDAVVQLSVGLLPLLRRQTSAALVNITSGLAIAPKKSAPLYCAAKAGLRTFTKALRYQCEDGAPHVLVADVVMGLVDTDMTAGRGRGKISPRTAARAVVEGLVGRRTETFVAQSAMLNRLSRLSPKLAERILRDA